jgi:aminoglycoside 6-adenylyltransferase
MRMMTTDSTATLIAWAQSQPAIRAMLLTSTRATAHARLDALSDYDVILVVTDIVPFATDRTWLNAFGEVLVAYWDAIHPDPEYGIEQIGNVVHYVSGLKIDFTIWPIAILERILDEPALPAELDAGYLVLLDKDNRTTGMLPATGMAYIPAKPTNEIYQTLIGDFFTDALYVAKSLWRDELMPAKWCLDYDMKYTYLIPLLEWQIETRHNWALPTGVNGKGLKRHLARDRWLQIEQTYSGAQIEDNWRALEQSIVLLHQVAIDVGAQLGYQYPDALERGVRKQIAEIRALARNGK